MTSLLALSQELFDRAANPATGLSANDEAARRLALAMGPDDIRRFGDEVARLDDPDALTSYGWTWVLEFAVGNNVALDADLLVELCQRWDEPALKALVIETALGTDDPEAGLDIDRNRPRPEPAVWLDRVVERAAPSEPDDDAAQGAVVDVPAFDDSDEQVRDRRVLLPEPVDINSAEALLIALLIVGSGAAMEAAQRLLRRSWPGAEALQALVAARIEDPDPVARLPWEEVGRAEPS